MMGFQAEDLPDVVLLKIFSYLHFGDLCKMGHVCQRWYHLSRSQVLWKTVDATDIQLTTEQMEKLSLILQCSVLHLHVRAVVLRKMPFLTPKIVNEIRERCPHLQTLIIEGAFIARLISWTDITVEDLPQKLKTLSLRKSFFHADQFFCSASHPTVPEIQCLDVSHCWFISDYDIPFFTRLSDLRELYLEDCDKITDYGVSMLTERAEFLQVLDLEKTKVSDDTLDIIASRCPTLQKLFLGRTQISDRAMSYLLPASLNKLKVLCLAKTMVSNEGLSIAVTKLTGLQWVRAADSQVTAEGVTEITALISPDRTLTISLTYRCPGKVACEHFFVRNG